MTITYRHGGGFSHNLGPGQITEIIALVTKFNSAVSASKSLSIKRTIEVYNESTASGGTDRPTLDDMRSVALNYQGSQDRVVTKQDLLTRVYTMPSKFGRIKRVNVVQDQHSLKRNLNLYVLSENSSGNFTAPNSILKENLRQWLIQYRMINDQLDFGFTINNTLFSGYVINFGVRFIINYDRRLNPTEVKLNVIQVIKNFFAVEKMQFRQSINLNDLQYNILGLEGVIGIKELKLFQDGNTEYANGRQLYYYKGDGEVIGTDSNYGFKYNFDNAIRDGIIRPSVSSAVFELKNPNQDIYGKVI